VSWASEAVGAIRKIVLIEDRLDRVANQVEQLAESCQELDHRLVRMEAKFELIEKVAATRPRSIRRKSEI
jgi:predicted  nucleic acid-binding Zn-ribbon protein